MKYKYPTRNISIISRPFLFVEVCHTAAAAAAAVTCDWLKRLTADAAVVVGGLKRLEKAHIKYKYIKYKNI